MNRQEKNEARREAILQAALAEFSSRGFAAARMEDIARRAGVAKGTLYLHFTDKAGLFVGLINAYLAPVHQQARSILDEPDLSLTEKLLRISAPLRANNGFSPAAEVIRLLHSEGLHNPELTAIYLTTLLGPVLDLHREYLSSHEQQAHPALRAHPQLLMGPLIHGILWQGLFGKEHPLDLEAMYRAYLDMILRPDS